MEAHPASALLSQGADLRHIADAAAVCTQCELYKDATQTVFGMGPVPAPLMLVGEQPGDKEDLAGEPFVGPAGSVLDEAMKAAGMDPAKAYVTNAVKHFKFERRGKKRIHKRPYAEEIRACMPWFEAELERVDPEVVVCLGATAAKAILGSGFKVSTQGGVPIDLPNDRIAVATIHPSAVLRAAAHGDRQTMMDRLIHDLHTAHSLIGASTHRRKT